MKTSLHFLMAARRSEIGELEQLTRTSALVGRLGQLIHALQKERGLANVWLASQGIGSADAHARQAVGSTACEQDARAALDVLDTAPDRALHSARLFSRIAYVLQGLDALPALRARIQARGIDAAGATAAYARLVGGLLAVVFEAADSASDPEVSRLLVALFNFLQGKEFAGLERATGAAAFGSGASESARQQQWLHLIDSQERCFQVFAELAPAAALLPWQSCNAPGAIGDLERLRRIGCTAAEGMPLDPALSATWFDNCTRRMDAMQPVEAELATSLLARCRDKIALARTELQAHEALAASLPDSPQAQPADNGFFDSPAGALPAGSYGPQLDRSVLELVQEQSQRLQAMRDELDTVRATLTERKVVERAKGLLMAHRHLSEGDAHKLLRQTAMSQNRRLVDVAEAVLAMADLLPGTRN